jgi:coproporphyrinogen III oxidase
MDTASNYKTNTAAFRGSWIEYICHLQEDICNALEAIDGKAKFIEDNWERAEGRGGGGKTRVISNGNVFQKGGVITSVVCGRVNEKM